ncbi:hypothetical protein GGS26DRAFT_592633 [Hypomontagnella submonticulosa]|nr:hypothetical protein GGS26DRAFT_592633 [Hypomontagnella submonticulosa]
MSFGRGGTYPVWLLFYVLAAILSAKAPNYESYAVGYMLHMFAQTGVNTMNDVLAADMSTARQRDFAVQLLLHVVYYIPWLFGGILWWTRRYKWLIFAGVAIRFIGYRLMFRIRDSRSTTAEIIIVQVIQGMGDALVGTCSFVVSTVAVAHKEVAQMTSLAVCLSTLGSTVGTAIGGGIYTRSSWLRHPCHFLQAPVTSADRWAYPV